MPKQKQNLPYSRSRRQQRLENRENKKLRQLRKSLMQILSPTLLPPSWEQNRRQLNETLQRASDRLNNSSVLQEVKLRRQERQQLEASHSN
jgi:hypothetical protein